MGILRKIQHYYQRLFWNYEKRARYAGVNLGEDNFISSHFWSSEAYLITIGNNCSISHGVKMFTHGGGRVARKIIPSFDIFGKIKIGNYVYIGNNSLIMPGVEIGDNVLIAAGSVVTKSVPSNMVIGGNPARILCTTEEYIQRNKRWNLDSKGLSKEAKRKLLTNLDEDKFIRKSFLKP